MKILVLGSNGMLGHTLIRYLNTINSLHVEFSIRDKSKQELCRRIFGREASFIVDAFNPQSALDAISTFNPDFCINCLGLIKQKDESKNFIRSIQVNSLLPHQLSNYCAENNSKLIHISTDCVYSGVKGNYKEDDIPDPVDFYGRSKLLGEVCNKNAITIRTSIIGPEINYYKGLFEWFRNCEDLVYGYQNALYSGFPTIELSKIIYKYILKKNIKNGIYNISSNPINKLSLLKLINDVYDFNKNIVADESFIIDRTLDCQRFIDHTGFKKSSWKDMLESMRDFG